MADAAVTSHDDGPTLKLVIKNPYDGNDWAIAVPVSTTVYDLKVKICRECKCLLLVQCMRSKVFF